MRLRILCLFCTITKLAVFCSDFLEHNANVMLVVTEVQQSGPEQSLSMRTWRQDTSLRPLRSEHSESSLVWCVLIVVSQCCLLLELHLRKWLIPYIGIACGEK